MNSRTKAALTTENMDCIIRQQFPQDKVLSITELSDGMCNAAWMIRGTGRLSNGVVLKVGPGTDAELLTYEKDKLRTEILVYQMLEDRDIPTPRLLGADTSRSIIPNDYFFIEAVPGSTWKSCMHAIPSENMPGLKQQLGRCNAAVHSVEGDWFGYIKEDARFRFDTWGGAFTAMMKDILDDGRQRAYMLPYHAIERALSVHRHLLDAVETPRLVDFDLWAGNVFVDHPDCTGITGVIDFEQCFYGDPFADFTSAVHLFSDVSKENDFLKGYGEISGRTPVVTEDDEIRMDLYRLYMAVILYVEAYRFDDGYAAGVRRSNSKRMERLLKKLI